MEPIPNSVILLVSEEDGSDAYYRLSASHAVTLSRIHQKIFVFDTLVTTCKDDTVNMDLGLTIFLNRFRYGRYTSKWTDIAQQIKVVEHTDARCLPHDYAVTFTH
jgi:hypothetical protein